MKRIIRLTITFFAVCVLGFTSCTTSEIRSRLNEMGLKNATVNKTEEGITISLENIQFAQESAILRESEKEKLKQIAEILTMFEENNLLIRGHTALFGTKKGQKDLSERRARAVADYLVKLGVKTREKIAVQGLGAEVPIASNRTEAGKAKNRRVEITILDVIDDEVDAAQNDNQEEDEEEEDEEQRAV